MVREISKLMAPLARRASLMIGRGVLRLVNDSLKLQGVQVALLADEVQDGVERFQQYGFTSHPLPGAEAITVSVGGSRDHSVVIAIDDRRYRLTGLAAGEAALYTDEGDSIILKRGRVVEVNTETMLVKASTKVRFETPLVETTGQIRADGDITDQFGSGGRSNDIMRQVFDSHDHNDPQGGTVSTPNQVMG